MGFVLWFERGALKKLLSSDERAGTGGVRAEVVLNFFWGNWAPATSIALEIDSAGQYELRQKPVASWEDSQYSFNLVRSSFSNAFQLVISSKRVAAAADMALAEVVKVDELEAPAKAVAHQKKEADAIELTRQKNQKSFRP